MNNNLQESLHWIAGEQQTMLDTLCQWSHCNSGSFHIQGLQKMSDLLENYITQHLVVDIQRHDLTTMPIVGDDGKTFAQPLGQALHIKKKTASDEDAVRILLGGHYDTVFAKEHAFQTTTQLGDNRLGGPGVADMKGGILVMLNALRAIEKTPLSKKIDWQIILNPDEEVGSLGSAHLLESAAKKSHIGMVYEPAMADGFMAGARKGSGNYTLVVHGKAAHAGREFALGRNAIAALSEAIQELLTLNHLDGQITLNLGSITGGGPNNIVADLALCRFNVRVANYQEQQIVEKHLEKVITQLNEKDGFHAELHGLFTRPAKTLNDKQKQLMQLFTQSAETLGISTGFRDTGGCCDGNNLAAAGLVNIDTLGVQGGDIHSDKEYMLIDSLVNRTQLSTHLLYRIAQNTQHWTST